MGDREQSFGRDVRGYSTKLQIQRQFFSFFACSLLVKFKLGDLHHCSILILTVLTTLKFQLLIDRIQPVTFRNSNIHIAFGAALYSSGKYLIWGKMQSLDVKYSISVFVFV